VCPLPGLTTTIGGDLCSAAVSAGKSLSKVQLLEMAANGFCPGSLDV